MKRVSRRELARTVARQLLDGKDQKRVMRGLAAYLVENKMLGQAEMLISDIAVELQNVTGHVSVEVRAAFVPSANMLGKLEAYAKKVTNAKSVELTVKEDLALVGGVVISTPMSEYDASVRRKLNQLARGEA